MKVFIVDDEPAIARDLQNLIALFCPELELSGVAHHLKEADQLITSLKPDLVFLDIEVGNELSTDWLKNKKEVPFKVIFVTAHDQYAAKAFRLSAIDYLLKPIDPELLKEAVAKVDKLPDRSLQTSLAVLTERLTNSGNDKIVLPDIEGVSIIKLDQILYCKANGSYCEFNLHDGRKLTTSHHLKYYEDLLGKKFFRIHRSYLINLSHIVRIDSAKGSVLISNGEEIPSTVKLETLITMVKNI